LACHVVGAVVSKSWLWAARRSNCSFGVGASFGYVLKLKPNGSTYA
jgi:hypothetical protein